ncbi:MAG: T9SS type A sorting domain-containing protein [Salinivirgaceae bacterium]
MRTITFLMAMGLALGAIAQNYQTVNQNRIAHFANQQDIIQSIRIDSTATDQTVLYPFYTVQQSDAQCYMPHQSTWIGEKIEIQPNGENWFYNKNSEKITINTRAHLNEQWVAFEIPDSITVIASITAHEELSFLGLTDSVKTISFECFDDEMNSLNYELNNFTIQISKNYGLIKTLNFILFPNHVNYNPYQSPLREYTLVGMTNPTVGVQNLTWLEVYNFSVDDELHIIKEIPSWEDHTYTKTIQSIFKYLQRTDYNDSIRYKYTVKQTVKEEWADSGTFTYTHDTLFKTYAINPNFDKLPHEPTIDGSSLFFYEQFNSDKIAKRHSIRMGAIDNNCWDYLVGTTPKQNYRYLKNLGGPYYVHYPCKDDLIEKRELVYYKKGDSTWGTPLELNAIKPLVQTPVAAVFPNPAKNTLTIDMANTQQANGHFIIYTIEGQVASTHQITEKKTVIDISKLKNGVYFYKLINDMNHIQSNKLIIN